MVIPRVVLVGPPGAGKSTVGRLLARELDAPFHDTDEAVEAAAGKSVAEIFFDEGEPRFRALEAAAVSSALAGQDGVVALGGGAVLAEPTRLALLDAPTTVVWLDVSMPQAAKRVGLARDRPVLALNPRAQLHALLAERAPLYEQVATFRVDTDGLEPDAVAEAILERL